MTDAEHPFFRPLWRRIVVVAICAGWTVFEFVAGSPFWGTLAAGMTAYGARVFLLNYSPPPAGDAAAPGPDQTSGKE